MKRALLVCPLLACATDPEGPPPDDAITGFISADEVWSGTRDLRGFVVVEPGVTVTIEPGTTIRIAEGASIEVNGAISAVGTKEAPIALVPAVEETYWLGINVAGAYTLHHGTQVSGGIYTVKPEATVEVRDSELWNSIGDLIVMDGGSVDVQYTNLGREVGNHTHCNVHINSGERAVFTHNNNAGVSFGLMLYGASGDFSSSNWFGNAIDIEPNPGGTGVFDGSYFAKGRPGGVTGSSFENLASAPIADAGPR
jgi:hypothetical protein